MMNLSMRPTTPPAPRRVVDFPRIAVMQLPIDAIVPNPHQPRQVFDPMALESLAASIRQNGLIQPIQVRQVGGHYELIAGERRLRACKMAGFETISALILPAVSRQSALMAMVENLQRENLHFFEEAIGYEVLLREHSMTQEELARQLGVNQSTVANKLRLLKLSAPIRQKILQSELTERHARALLKVADETLQQTILDKVIARSLSVKDTETLIEQTLAGQQSAAGQMTYALRDVRLYVNTLRDTLRKLQQAGASAQMTQEDLGDAVQITITLQKRNQAVRLARPNR